MQRCYYRLPQLGVRTEIGCFSVSRNQLFACAAGIEGFKLNCTYNTYFEERSGMLVPVLCENNQTVIPAERDTEAHAV